MIRRSRAAFSLLELVIVCGIVGALVGLLLPAVQRVREAASRTRCLDRLHQLGLAFHQYHDGHGTLPSGINSLRRSEPMPKLAWPARLLPYVERADLWDGIVRDYAAKREPFYNPSHSGFDTVVSAFLCPSDPRVDTPQNTHYDLRAAFTSFVGNLGRDYESKDGVLFLESKVKCADVTDGTSNTLLAGERPPSNDFWYGWWYAGTGQLTTGSLDMLLGARERNAGVGFAGYCPPGPHHFAAGTFFEYCDVFHYWSLHGGGANFLLADGSARFLAYSADSVLPAMATRAGGENFEQP